MKKYTTSDINLPDFVRGTYRYEPRNIQTEGIHVTVENIGALCIELELELRYTVDQNEPFFEIPAARDELLSTYRLLIVRPNMWLVALRKEIHVFGDTEFDNTFTWVPPHQLTPEVREAIETAQRWEDHEVQEAAELKRVEQREWKKGDKVFVPVLQENSDQPVMFGAEVVNALPNENGVDVKLQGGDTVRWYRHDQLEPFLPSSHTFLVHMRVRVLGTGEVGVVEHIDVDDLIHVRMSDGELVKFAYHEIEPYAPSDM